MKNIFFVLIVFAISFSACTKKGCTIDKACTEEFVSITVSLNYLSSFPYVDEVRTFKKANNKLVFQKENLSMNQTALTILSDAEINETSLKAELFILKGYQGGSEVFSEEYELKNDCCHIIKVSGKDSIIL